MSTQSKSVLVPFLIIAALIFAVALGWKMMNGDSSTANVTENKVAEVKTTDKAEATKKPTEIPEIEVVKYEAEDNLANIPVTEEEIKVARNRGKNFMTFSMQLKTPEQALKALQDYVDMNNTETANDLILYIEDTFPGTEIPSDLLDF